MIAFILPFAVIAGVLMLSGRARENAPPPPASPALIVGATPPWAPGPRRAPQPPSPLAVLSDYIHANTRPPPFVVQCAIAEAELLGRFDLAHTITKTFLLPTLMQGGGAPQMQAPTAPIDAKAEEKAPAAPQNPATPATETTPAASSPAPMPEALPRVTTRSPIRGLPDEAWHVFAGLLVREAPTFDAPRHVGRYHHRKDRLLEIGFDPAIVLESVDVQDDAFAADVGDAFTHLMKSGTLEAVVGKGVAVPGVDAPVQITPSGVLALAAVGGLEGAIGWLERTSDREKYPHTTQAFMRCNGVF